MKFKTILLSGLFLLPFFSCENREDVNTVNIETELIAEISLTSESTSSLNLKSQSNGEVFAFTGSAIFCLAQNNDLNKPMCYVTSIKHCQGCKIVFQDVVKDGNILSMKLYWDSKSDNETDFVMQNEIDISSLPYESKNGNREIDISGIIVPFVNCMDSNPTCLYRIDITGTADFVMPSTGRLIIPVSAESKVPSVNFTLF